MAPRSRPHTKHTTQHREAHVKFASKSRRRKRTHPRVGTQPPSRDTCVPMGPTPAACTTHTCRRGAPRPEGAPTSDSRLVCPQTRTPAARRNRGQTHASLSRGRPGRGWHAGALANDTRPSLIDVVCSGGVERGFAEDVPRRGDGSGFLCGSVVFSGQGRAARRGHLSRAGVVPQDVAQCQPLADTRITVYMGPSRTFAARSRESIKDSGPPARAAGSGSALTAHGDGHGPAGDPRARR